MAGAEAGRWIKMMSKKNSSIWQWDQWDRGHEERSSFVLELLLPKIFFMVSMKPGDHKRKINRSSLLLNRWHKEQLKELCHRSRLKQQAFILHMSPVGRWERLDSVSTCRRCILRSRSGLAGIWDDICNLPCIPNHLCAYLLTVSSLCNPMDCSPPDSSVHENSPGKNTGVGCNSLLQAIFTT